MINIKHHDIKQQIFDGTFGLERETLRVDKDGYLAQTPHPFKDDRFIVKDFCENQAEINTGVHLSAKGVIAELAAHTKRLCDAMVEDEVLWMYSNPPYLRSEEEIPVAVFGDDARGKFSYRMYLCEKYGKRKMTLSGIHVNYSFSDKLLKTAFDISGEDDFTAYKNGVYLTLAQGLAEYGWINNLLICSSPLSDGSYEDPKKLGEDSFNGFASLRCSSQGYWNRFVPILSYEDIKAYAGSIQRYIDDQSLISASELYYPIRLKPRGRNRLNLLVQNGVNHIEIRNIDLNPFCDTGIDERDLKFIELLIIYLGATYDGKLSENDQLRAVKNFQSAAEFDIDKAKIILSNGEEASAREAGLKLLSQIRGFFDEHELGVVHDTLDFQLRKLTQSNCRYAEKVIHDFSGGYVTKGLRHFHVLHSHITEDA